MWVRSRKSVVVVKWGRDEFMIGMRVRRVMRLSGGKNANALSLRIRPSAWSMKDALSVGASALMASLGGVLGLSLIAWLVWGGG